MPKSHPRPDAELIPEWGTRLRLLREQAGLSQAELARRAQLPDPSLLSRFEGGSRAPSLLDARRLAIALGVSLDSLTQ